MHGAEGHRGVHGVVRLRRAVPGVELEADLRGLRPGVYTYRVHTSGDCSAVAQQSPGPRLELPALASLAAVQAEDGAATARTHLGAMAVTTLGSLVGRAVVVASADGEPVGCGVLGIVGEAGPPT